MKVCEISCLLSFPSGTDYQVFKWKGDKWNANTGSYKHQDVRGRVLGAKTRELQLWYICHLFFFCSWTQSGSYLSSHSGMLHNLSVEQIQPGKLSCPTILCSASHFGRTYDGFLPWLQLEQMTSPTLCISFLPPPLSEAPHFSFSLSLSPFLNCVCLSVHVKGLYKFFGVLFARSWAGNYLLSSKGSAWRTLHMQHS